MGKNIKMVKEFIEGIPDSKLEGLPSTVGTIYKTTDFRLDMQGMTSGDPKMHTFQVTSLKMSAPQTVATLLVLKDNPPSAADIKNSLVENITI